MTAYGDEETASQAEAAGAMGYLTKPVTIEQVMAAIGPAQARFAEWAAGREA